MAASAAILVVFILASCEATEFPRLHALLGDFKQKVGRLAHMAIFPAHWQLLAVNSTAREDTNSTRNGRTPSKLFPFLESYARRKPLDNSTMHRRLFVGGSKRGNLQVGPDLITAPSQEMDLVVSADLDFDSQPKLDPFLEPLGPTTTTTVEPFLKRAPLEDGKLNEARAPAVYRIGLDGVPVRGSTYFPINLKESSVFFGGDANSGDKNEKQNEQDNQDDEDTIVFAGTRLTTEKLAYVLIGACCSLSILCLVLVAICLHCRKTCARRRLRRRLKMGPPLFGTRGPYWRHQGYFSYFHDSSCSSYSCESCGCRCTAWTLGARNLDNRFGPLRRGGPRKLPFGAASSLHFQALGRAARKPTVLPPECSCSGGSKCSCTTSEEESPAPAECTCVRPATGEWETPPVSGSNYLKDSKGVVFWSNNDERLI